MRMKNGIQIKKKLLLVALLACALFILQSNKVWSQNGKKGWEAPPRKDLKGQIEKPANMSKVPRHFKVSGSISGTTRHLWLVVRIGDQHWPKEPELRPTAGRWHSEVHEGGQPPEGKFEILLMDVSTETASKFQEWLQTGQQTGSYPGIPLSQLGSPTIIDTKIYKLKNK